ncbi:MAG TPA: DUF6516 family protein [Xanthomonadales bacterium]|nr:DUF6516 family protein [Xanthomonadales bacterium]
MKAVELVRQRIVVAPDAFTEIVIWALPRPLAGSAHSFKYRLAYVIAGECVLRYDNESGKGDHRHYGKAEKAYAFVSPDGLMADFLADVTRWNHENGRS